MGRRSERVLGVLLAAGVGTRFEGRNKLLADVEAGMDYDHQPDEPEPLVRLSAGTLVEAPVDDAVAVVGYQADAVAEALGPVEIATVRNPDYESGQATSVAQGVAWARDQDADAALFALGDMPWVRVGTCRAIVGHWRESDADIVVPEYGGRRGNPVLFDAAHFEALASVSGDTGGRELIERHPIQRVAVDDPGIHRDVDEEADIRTE
jgi:molybdenum cofactor cytidylyltransferase